jgi:hypothetical protein
MLFDSHFGLFEFVTSYCCWWLEGLPERCHAHQSSSLWHLRRPVAMRSVGTRALSYQVQLITLNASNPETSILSSHKHGMAGNGPRGDTRTTGVSLPKAERAGAYCISVGTQPVELSNSDTHAHASSTVRSFVRPLDLREPTPRRLGSASSKLGKFTYLWLHTHTHIQDISKVVLEGGGACVKGKIVGKEDEKRG